MKNIVALPRIITSKNTDMKKQLAFFAAITIAVLLLATCNKQEFSTNQTPQLPENPYDYTVNTFVDNDLATLGRVLFYDNKLSVNNAVSCASCHKQARGFSDGKVASTGFGGRTTRRNAPGLSNLRWYYSFFWDARVNNLESLILQPVQDHIEMGMEDIGLLTEKLSNIDYYPPLFEAAYGTPDINAEGISAAMTHFLLAMVSLDSKMDKENDGDVVFTTSEQTGKDLFFSERGSCGNCHGGTNLGATFSANIGLDLVYEDNGMGEVSSSSNPSSRNGEFKIPGLRNIALTAPYMHDGRFETLEEVIDHYSSGIQAHPNLSVQLSDNPNCWGCPGPFDPVQRNFSNAEKQSLIAFLHTLTDYSFMGDPKYSDPFDY